jgi:hypothetical protein
VNDKDIKPAQAEKDEPGFQGRIVVLSGLLVLQIGLAVLLFFGQAQYRREEPFDRLVRFNCESAGQVTVEVSKTEAKPQVIVLKKQENAWVLPDEHNLPVDNAFMQLFLNVVADWKKGIPVASTDEAKERFKVAANNYELAITLSDDRRQSCRFFVGTAPAYKSRYVRLSDSNNIYAVELPDSFQLPAQLDDVIDKHFLKPDIPAISSLSIGEFSAQVSPSKSWLLRSGPQSLELDGNGVRNVLQRVFNFPVRSFLGVQAKADYNMDSPDLVVKLGLTGGKTDTYSFLQPRAADRSSRVLKVASRDGYFSVDDVFVESIRQLPARLMAEARMRAEKITKSRTAK